MSKNTLLADVRALILQARQGVAQAVNSGLTTLYWHIGRRIREDILREKRAEYGERIVSALGTQLTAEFGRGFGSRNLFRMVRFAEVFPDLKIGDFEAGDKGQMELYLNWLKRYECEPDEESPLGLILCAGRRQQHVELLELEKSGIHVASYWTEVLPKKELERKLHDAVRLARARLEQQKA